MAIKSLNKLFLEKQVQKLIPLSSSLQDLGNQIESAEYIKVFKEHKERFIPHVDYSKPDNWVKYGSAKQYYIDAVENIYLSYPYDGSLKEKLQWHLTSSYFENYVFENEYPRTNGHIYLTGSRYSGEQMRYGRPDSPNYISIPGSINVGNLYDAVNSRTTNLDYNLDNGVTVEFWMKKTSFPTNTEREVLFDLWNSYNYGTDGAPADHPERSKYGRLRIEMDSSEHSGANATAIIEVLVGNGLGNGEKFSLTDSAGVTTEYTINGGVAATSGGGSGGNATVGISAVAGGATAAARKVLAATALVEGINRTTDANYTAVSDGVSKVTITQGTKGIGGNTVKVLGTPALNTAGATISNFTGGIDAVTFLLTALSGSRQGVREAVIGRAEKLNTTNVADSKWHHYAFTFKNTTLDNTATITVADGDAASGMTEKQHITITSADGTTKRYVLTDANADDTTVTGTVLSDSDNTDTGSGTAGADEDEGIAVSIDLTGTPATQNAFLVQLKAAIEHASGHNGKITVSDVPTEANTSQSITLTQATSGPDGNTEIVTNLENVTKTDFAQPLDIELYYDGKFVENILTGTTIHPVRDKPTSTSIAAIGALTAKSSSFKTGDGKLFGYLDEFRYWKTRRDAKQIGTNWFGQVGGGTNTDKANTKLGIYYKFNEGISGKNYRDSVILDYSGRVSNGKFVGYIPGSEQRNVGSAMVSSSAAKSEFKDPIIYFDHPDVKSYYDDKSLLGAEYDHRNPTFLYHTFPAWVVEGDSDNEGELKKLSQIVASYFDTLYSQIREIPNLKSVNYPSGSEKPYPFVKNMLEDKGFFLSDIFTDANLIEEYSNKSEDFHFVENLHNVKNRIYQNIYNNLSYIYKTKGTEKSIKALLRSMGLGDNLVKINYYGNNLEYELKDNFRSSTQKKRMVDFTSKEDFGATVYQDSENYPKLSGRKSTNNVRSYIATNKYYYKAIPMTLEANIFFPKKFPAGSKYYNNFNELTSSLFGIHTPLIDREKEYYVHSTTWRTTNRHANLSVYAVRDKIASKHAKFFLSGNFGILSSSYVYDLYDNNHWNVSVQVRPENQETLLAIENDQIARRHDDPDDNPDPDVFLKTDPKDPVPVPTTGHAKKRYIMEFYGVSANLGTVSDSFYLTKSMDFNEATAYLTSSKKVFCGAHRTNFTGAIINKSDVKVSSIRYWLSSLSKKELQSHVRDIKNYGVDSPYRNFQTSAKYYVNVNDPTKFQSPHNALSGTYIPKYKTLALHWNFENVTGSDAQGKFFVDDFSSGSMQSTLTGSDINHTSYGILSGALHFNYPGSGSFFKASDNNAVIEDFVYTSRQQLPEVLNSSDQIEIRTNDDDVYVKGQRPVSYYVAVEKSPYQIVSDDMINIFSTIIDFNNLIGAPVNKYRFRYKELEKLRDLFFQRVKTGTKLASVDFDAFLEFYKWIDFTINKMLQQLLPVSANVAEDIRTVVESHILERSKIQHRHPAILKEMKAEFIGAVGGNPSSVIDAPMTKTLILAMSQPLPGGGLEYNSYNIPGGYEAIRNTRNTSNTKRDENVGILRRLDRPINSDHATSGDTTIDATRERIRKILVRGHNRKAYTPTIRGSVAPPISTNNRNVNKTVRIEKESLPHKNTSGESTSDYIEINANNLVEEPSINSTVSVYTSVSPGKKRRSFDATVKRYQGASYYSETTDKTTRLAHFAIYQHATAPESSVVGTNFKSKYEFTNLHSDGYGHMVETPMQGPFTETYVGGMQHRHSLMLGLITDNIAVVSARENMRPEAWRIRFDSNVAKVYGPGASGPHYPRSWVYRDGMVKRPVNIQNIQSSQSSPQFFKYGNYQRKDEVVQTAGRNVNNLWLIHHSGVISTTEPESYAVSGDYDFELEDRTYLRSIRKVGFNGLGYDFKEKPRTVIAEKFSAPGGPEVNSLGFQDRDSRTYSVYNNLNYRNLVVRRPHNQFLSNREGKFQGSPGYDGIFGSATASFHKTHNNAARRIEITGPSQRPPVATSSYYNNAYVTTPIPASDTQYTWITASLSTFAPGAAAPLGYAPQDGLDRDYSGVRTVFKFKQTSHQLMYKHSTMAGYRGPEPDGLNVYGGASSGVEKLYIDFAGMNHIIVDPIDKNLNLVGYDSTGSSNLYSYLNTSTTDATTTTWLSPKMLNLLFLHRDGPYKYPTWKQIRTGERRIARRQRENNTLNIYDPPKRTVDTAKNIKVASKSTIFTSYKEPAVTSKYKPIGHMFLVKDEDISNLKASQTGQGLGTELDRKSNNKKTSEVLYLKHTYGNHLATFSRKEIDNKLNVIKSQDEIMYDDLTGIYLYNGLEEHSSIKKFLGMKYEERVYPREQNEYLARTFTRQNYKVDFWRTLRADRTLKGQENSFGFHPGMVSAANPVNTSSMWPLDARIDFETRLPVNLHGYGPTASPNAATFGRGGEGELQNDYSIFHNKTSPGSSGTTFMLAPLYARRILENATYDLPSQKGFFHVAGDTKWETGKFSGKEPFPSGSYNDWAEDLRRQGKDHSILPEFRISEHMDFYIKDKNYNWLSDNPGFLTLTGSALSNSAQGNFMKTYSHTDFLEHFNIIDEHKNTSFKNDDMNQTAVPSSITLTCKALMKFLPYNGFYPATRTLELSNLFSASYFPGISTNGDPLFKSKFTPNTGRFRPLYSPFFQPGILYNSIKAGVAVDYPIFLNTHNSAHLDTNKAVILVTGSSQGTFPHPELLSYEGDNIPQPRLKANFDKRLPFESLLDPAEQLTGYRVLDMEPHKSASLNVTASIEYVKDNRYKFAMHNFLAETQNFFVDRTVIKSDFSDNDGRFGVMPGRKDYCMDIMIRQTPNFVTYDRRSAFGPPSEGFFVKSSVAASAGERGLRTQRQAGATSQGSVVGTKLSYSPFTPPYMDLDYAETSTGYIPYTGSLARIVFKPSENSPTLDNSRYDLNTILSASLVEYYRNGFRPFHFTPTTGHTASIDNAMQISASLNMFTSIYDYQNSVISTPIGLRSGPPELDPDKAGRKWVIDTKFETPILNFNYKKTAGSANSIAIPTHGSSSLSVGMWHQYGYLPKNSNEGVVIEIADVPGSGSLADVVGLRKGIYQLGRVPNKKKVKEAVVAIPFRTIDDKKYFFKIDRKRVDLAIGLELLSTEEEKQKVLDVIGKDVVEMIQKMRNYVFPPQFDFLTFNGKGELPEVDPLAMCIFEFEHDFSQKDISDMWQNLAPDLAYTIKEPRESVATISHPLLLDGFKKKTPIGLQAGRDNKIESEKAKLNFFELSKDLRWMVFKVKQKAETNYYKTLQKQRGETLTEIEQNERRVRDSKGRPDSALSNNASTFGSKEIEPLYSYNWPYDFFTMIELAKIDASIDVTPQNIDEVRTKETDQGREVVDVLQKVFNVKD